MACFGSRPLRRNTLKSNLDEMNEDDKLSKRWKDASKKSEKGNGHNFDNEESLYKQHEAKKKKKEFKKQHQGVTKDGQSKKSKAHMPAKSKDATKQNITLRKKVDPETAKYFTEIAKLFESNEVDIDERSAICGNALEETRGKEVELATDMIISHTLQILLEGCDLEQLCGFLQNCAKEFPSIVTDKFGSHVAETALKTLN